MSVVAPSVHVPPEDPPESPFSPPYRSDACIEHRVVQLQSHRRMLLEAGVQSMHQAALVRLVSKVHACPEPVLALLEPECTPGTDIQNSERIHAVMQLQSQIRELEHQAQLKKAYKLYGTDHRTAAKELYARSQFTIAYMHYWTLFSCLSCDACRQLAPAERHNLAVDLLEKLAVTCLRAGWLADAANFATEALAHEDQSTRARIWLATAHLGLGALDKARAQLSLLPRRGHFPRAFPPWIEPRVVAQREVLARLEQEQRGVFNFLALEEDATDRVPETPHSTATFQVEATPAGWRTVARVAKDALLLVAPPVACAPCYAAETEAQADVEAQQAQSQPQPQLAPTPEPESEPGAPSAASASKALPPILHTPSTDASDPNSLFSLALVADSVFEQAKAHAHASSHPHAPPPADPASLSASFLALPPPRAARTAHQHDPPALTLAVLADAVHAEAKVAPVTRVSVRGAAARVVAAANKARAKEGRGSGGEEDAGPATLLEIVGNELRAASILVAQYYTIPIPHPAPRATRTGPAKSSSTATAPPPPPPPLDRPAHAGHAIYVPALKLVPCASPAEGNTYPTFHGPYLFLRALTDLRAGTILTFGGFARTTSSTSTSTSTSASAAVAHTAPAPLRARVTALASTPPTSGPTSPTSPRTPTSLERKRPSKPTLRAHPHPTPSPSASPCPSPSPADSRMSLAPPPSLTASKLSIPPSSRASTRVSGTRTTSPATSKMSTSESLVPPTTSHSSTSVSNSAEASVSHAHAHAHLRSGPSSRHVSSAYTTPDLSLSLSS